MLDLLGLSQMKHLVLKISAVLINLFNQSIPIGPVSTDEIISMI